MNLDTFQLFSQLQQPQKHQQFHNKYAAVLQQRQKSTKLVSQTINIRKKMMTKPKKSRNSISKFPVTLGMFSKPSKILSFNFN